MLRLLFAVSVVVLSASVAPACAAPDAQAYALFEAGDYERAAARGVMLGGGENLALAARALNAGAYLQDDDKAARDISKRALDIAEEAMTVENDRVEGHLQAAIALAQRGARMSPVRAFFLGVAGRARSELDAALAMEPDNPWALSSSAAWHLEVARRVGEGRFGSDSALGFAQFEQARTLDPENIVIAYECALRMLAFGKAEWRAPALASLDMATVSQPADAFERAIKQKADAFAAAIAAGSAAERAYIDAQP